MVLPATPPTAAPTPGSCRICGACSVSEFPTDYAAAVWRCRDCDARFVYPIPTREELEERYEAEHSSGKWQALFDQTPVVETVRRAKLFTEIAGGPGRLLDVGFGDARFLRAARLEGWDTWGLELAESAAQSASAHHRVVVGELGALRFGPRFDAITFWDVLEHVPGPIEMVREAGRLLRPGGVLGMTMPNVHGAESLTQGGGWKYYDLDRYGHLFHLGPDHLSRLLSDAGLETLAVRTSGSIDLRNLLDGAGDRWGARIGRQVLDRVSGIVARAATPLKRGNTLMVVGWKPDANRA
ncbi:MAG: class I SAM-dependent methyltransferase [Longimicrobiales bacterium]